MSLPPDSVLLLIDLQADDLRRVRGTLLEVACGQSELRITLDTPDGKLSLTIPDPNPVLVEYAAVKGKDGIVRGVEFQ